MAAITITIGSDVVCAHAPKGRPRLSIQETLNGRATAQVTIMDPDHADWLASLPGGFKLQEITILDGSDKLFAGIVTNQRNYSEKELKHGYIDLRATDFAIRLDARRIFRVWEAGETINSIVGNILDHEPPSGDTLGDEGFTKAATSSVPIIGQRFISDGLTASEILNQLAALTRYIWYVDWDKDIHFELPGSNAAPFDIDETDCVFKDLSTEQSTDNLRNIEWSRQQFAALPALTQVFAGNGTDRGFLVDFPVGEAPVVIVRDATYAQATITLIGIPAAGDTATLDGDVYTYRTALTSARDVLIGGTFTECARNLAYAINNAVNWAGIYFDSATAAHPTCEAAYAGGVVVTVRVKAIGTGNGTTLSDSSAAINVSSSTLTGAAAGTSTPKTVGLFGDPDGTADWYWSPASLAITQDNGATVLATGEFLEVQYHPLFSNSFPVQDAALVAADGPWENLSEAESSRTGGALYASALATIRRYGLHNVTILEYVVLSPTEPLANTLRSGMTQNIVLDDSHNFNGSALITGVTRSYFFGDGTWQTENRVAAIAYPGSAGNEPWKRWSDLFVPSSGGSSMGGGGTVIESSAGGATAVEAPGPITNFGTPSVDYTDPLRAVVTNTADLPTALNGFDGCEIFLMVDLGLGSQTGPYPCGHVPHEVGAAGPFNILVDGPRPTTGEDWTFFHCSRNPSKTAALVMTAGPDQSPNFTISITARPSSTAPPAAPNMDSFTGIVLTEEGPNYGIAGEVVFPTTGRGDITRIDLLLVGPLEIADYPRQEFTRFVGSEIPATGNLPFDTTVDKPRPWNAPETVRIAAQVYNSDGVPTDSPTESADIVVSVPLTSGASMGVTSASAVRKSPIEYNADGVEQTEIDLGWTQPASHDARAISITVTNPADAGDTDRETHFEVIGAWADWGVARTLRIGPWPTFTETTRVKFWTINAAGEKLPSPVTIDVSVTAGTGNLQGGRLAALSVISAGIASSAITAVKIATAAVENAKLAADSVDSSKISAATIVSGDIAAATILGSNIANATIVSGNVVDGTLVGADIAAATILGSNIAAATIVSGNIQDASILGADIAAATIAGSNIAAATIAAGNIVSGTITATQIASASITSALIQDASITGTDIAAATITGSNIQDASISGADLGSATITGSNIQDASISGADIASATIAAGNIAGSTITSGQIAANTITSGNILDGTIVAGDMANLTITAAKISALTITAGEIADLTINGTKITNSTLTDGKVAVGTLGGDKLQNSSITAAQIASAAITSVKIQDGSIVASDIQSGSITANELANGTVTASKIAALTITANEIANLTITSSKIASITADKIVAGTITGFTINGSFINAPNITATGGNFQVSINTTNAIQVQGTFSGVLSQINSAGFTTSQGGNSATMTPGSMGILGSSGQFAVNFGSSVSIVNFSSQGWSINPSGMSNSVFGASISMNGSSQYILSNQYRWGSAQIGVESIGLGSITTSRVLYAYDQFGSYIGKVPVFF